MPKKILVIDDEKDIVNLLASRLKANRYEVVTAFDGDEGLEKLKMDPIDLVVLDIKIPGEDGLVVLSTIKSNPLTEKLPVIVVSNFSNPELIEGAKLSRERINKKYNIYRTLMNI